MLDTVQIKHFYSVLPDETFLRRWRFLSGKKNPTWTRNAERKDNLPRLTMINTPNGIWHLSAETSLPKMLFGHNARLPNEREVLQCLHLIGDYVEAESNLPFNAATATVSLIHYAKDVCLGEFDVWKMIKILATKKLPFLQKNFYEDATIYFTSKARSKQIRIYPKLLEVLNDKHAAPEAIKYATGNLRFELCLTKYDTVDSFAKKMKLADKTTASLINETISDAAIGEVLENLQFFDSLSNDKSNLELLLEKYSTRKAMNLCGFLTMLSERGEGFYKDESLGFTKDAYFRDARASRKANVWKRGNSFE